MSVLVIDAAFLVHTLVTRDATRPMVQCFVIKEVAMNQLRDVRDRLLELHKAAVDAERSEYEALHGRQTAGAFLHALLHDEAFSWLRPWTALIVRIDELLDAPEQEHPRAAESEREACLRAVDALVAVAADADGNPQQRYGALLLSSPNVAVAHGALMRALGAAMGRADADHTQARAQ